MVRLICICAVFAISSALAGCGGTSSEIAPATEATGENPSPEQQRNWMEESMKHGGAPKGYTPPGGSSETSTPATGTNP